MNNKQNEGNRRTLDSIRHGSDSAFNNFIAPVADEARLALRGARDVRADLIRGYGESNMPAGLVPNSNGWFNLPDVGGGGADFSSAKAGYQKMADTGGDFDEAEGLFRGMSFDPSGMRYRATSVIPGMYRSLQNDMSRRRNIQGGYSPGFDASTAELTRQKAREGYHASRDVEADIADRDLAVQQARASGITGIAGQRAGNKLSALGGLTNIAGTEGSLAESAAGRRSSMQMGLLDAFMRDKAGRAAGLQDLYKSAPGDVSMLLDSWLKATGMQTGNQLQNIGIRSGIQDRSWMDMIPGLVGAAGAGFSAFGRPANTNNNYVGPQNPLGPSPFIW